MRVTISEEYKPSPDDITNEFWNSDAERQADILYSLALICKYNFPDFCNQMFSVGDQLDGLEDARADVLSCLNAMVENIERNLRIDND